MAKFIHLIEMVLTLLMLSRRSHSDMPCARTINVGSKDIITGSRENGLYVYIYFSMPQYLCGGYQELVRPVLEYGSLVWNPAGRPDDLAVLGSIPSGGGKPSNRKRGFVAFRVLSPSHRLGMADILLNRT